MRAKICLEGGHASADQVTRINKHTHMCVYVCVCVYIYIYIYSHTHHTYTQFRLVKKNCLAPDLLTRNLYISWGEFVQFRLYPAEFTTQSCLHKCINLFISTNFLRQDLLSSSHTHALWHDTYVSSIHLNHNHYKRTACYRQNYCHEE